MKRFLPYFFMTLLFSCQAEKEAKSQSKYLRWVGDIEFDAQLDDQNFKVCHGDSNVIQYFNTSKGFGYQGEKTAIWNIFQEKYQAVTRKNQNGWIRIRFIVNCEGKAGRFRLTAADQNYQRTTFDPKITSQLLKITKSLDGWQILENDPPRDYYLYLIFKIEDGQILEILP